MRAAYGVPLPPPNPEAAWVAILALLQVLLDTVIGGRFTNFWVFHFCRPYQSPACELRLKVS